MNSIPRILLSASFVVGICFSSIAAEPSAPATRPANRLPPGFQAKRNLEYAPGGGSSQSLDLFLPNETPASPLPLVVWIHGGGWAKGSKEGTPAILLLPAGYAVASINYRLTGEAKFPAQIYDCKAAIRFLRANSAKYHVDPNHIGVWGGSAGGHLVALVGTSADSKDIEGDVGGNLEQSSRVQCVVDWFGPTDMSVWADHAKAAGIPYKDPDKGGFGALFGTPLKDHADLIAKANPIAFINKNCPPFLIMHGDKDPTVPIGQSQMLLEALKTAGIESRLEIVPGAGHGGPGFQTPAVRAMVSEFLDKHLKAR